ncbi:probable G-protein coupled receptor 139 [Rhincodon typus]|uniref:probable G-protein coupled receptor 139 n=1 Tax=Rhincodon typus TaxID=259920 RepID=UPI00202E1C5D|nr:probable G-protein coupled receptor 139 [Rhincodon typus]XP_048475123.1 probable G-protein coupled receptor 139 [Rhincodon typus]XP_048475124.1 probable G-protein coupled receptor 139 [Rhincodon typus]XP_048475125.1 probable G-protein coupled receptor 139 [Rhincodon typus]
MAFNEPLILQNKQANLAVIVILSRRRCGLSGCIIYYLLSMAVADLLVIVTAVILNRMTGIFSPFSFLSITPVCSVRTAINFAVVDSSAWLTVTFTFDRFVAISCQKLKVKYCTENVAIAVIGIVSTLSSLKSIFIYFAFEPVYIMNKIPWLCTVKDIFYTSPAWTAYDWFRCILNPLLPFFLILLLNALTVRHILAANRARRRLRTQKNGENQSDPEMEKRKKSIVLLFAISGSFILLNLLFFVTIFNIRIGNATYHSGSANSNSTFTLQEGGYMLQILSSCINPFIYAGTQSKFRTELKKGIKYPLSLLINLRQI